MDEMSMDEMSMLLHEGGAGGGWGGVLLACREASRFGVSILYRGIFYQARFGLVSSCRA